MKAKGANAHMGGGGKFKVMRETMRPACMNTQASWAVVDQSEASALNPEQAGGETRLEVERLSQIKTQYAERVMCACVCSITHLSRALSSDSTVPSQRPRCSISELGLRQRRALTEPSES